MEGALVHSAIVPTLCSSRSHVRGRARAMVVRSMQTRTLSLGGFQDLPKANFLDSRSAIRGDFHSIVATQIARPQGRGSRAVVRALFERFTEKAIKALTLAEEEARRLGHKVGTEHLLLGLIGEGTGIAAKVLKSMGIKLKDARLEVEKITGQGSESVISNSPEAKRVLELSLEAARQLGHNYIGDEHMLLGLLVEGDTVAARVLESLGADPSNTHTRAIIYQIVAKTSKPT